MKIVYDWLKDFVDLTVTPQDLASRLALSGTNIASVEAQPLGGVIDAEVTSNRPDCLGVYGIAREVSAIFKLPMKSVLPRPVESSAAKNERCRLRQNSSARIVWPLHRTCDPRCKNPAFTCLAARTSRSRWCSIHQQCRGRNQLCVA